MDVLVYTALHRGHLSISVYGSQDFLSKKYTGCRICTTGLLNVFDRKSVMNQAMPNALKTKLCTFSFTEHSKIIAVILKAGQCYKLVWVDNLLCHSVSLIWIGSQIKLQLNHTESVLLFVHVYAHFVHMLTGETFHCLSLQSSVIKILHQLKLTVTTVTILTCNDVYTIIIIKYHYRVSIHSEFMAQLTELVNSITRNGTVLHSLLTNYTYSGHIYFGADNYLVWWHWAHLHL